MARKRVKAPSAGGSLANWGKKIFSEVGKPAGAFIGALASGKRKKKPVKAKRVKAK